MDMKRFFAIGLVICAAFLVFIDSNASQASSYLLTFNGKIDGSDQDVSGSMKIEQIIGPQFDTDGGGRSANFYAGQISGEIKSGAVSFSNSAHFNPLNLVKGVVPNFLGRPFDKFEISTGGAPGDANSIYLNILSWDTDPSLPLLTLETMPATLADWVARFGPLGDDFYGISQFVYGSTSYQFRVTGYTLSLATTPIPAAALMFGTALASLLGLSGVRRRRAAA